MMMTNIKAVFFDIDDTLFDRAGAQHEALGIILGEFEGIFQGMDKEKITNAFHEADRISTEKFYAGMSIGESRIERSRIFLRILGLSEKHARKISELYVSSYPRIDAPVKSAKSVINQLYGKFQLGAISNSSGETQYQKLETLGIKELFDCIVLSEEIGIRKPDPRIFWKASSLLSKNPEECLHVGDLYEDDVIGAKNAGMGVCWLNPHGYSRGNVEPDFEIRKLDEIIEILKKSK